MVEREESGLSRIADLVGRHSRMESLLVPAFVDLDSSSRQVKLFPRLVSIKSGAGYLTLGIDEDSGQLSVADGQELEMPSALRGEPSIQPVFADLSPNYLDEARPLRCLSVLLFFDADSSASANRFRAVALGFDDERVLFFDPFWPQGIRIGGGFEAARLRLETPDGGVAELVVECGPRSGTDCA